MIDIRDLKALIKLREIAITEHARKRLIERGISVADIIQCISEGEITEQYEDDKPFPSCLISGCAENGEAVHSVVSRDESYLYLITAYHPCTDKWGNDYKTGNFLSDFEDLLLTIYNHGRIREHSGDPG